MRVERVSDNARNQKFKVKDERGTQQADNGRKPEVVPPGNDAARGNKPDRQLSIRCVNRSSRTSVKLHSKRKANEKQPGQAASTGRTSGQSGEVEPKQQSKGAPKQERKQAPLQGAG